MLLYTFVVKLEFAKWRRYFWWPTFQISSKESGPAGLYQMQPRSANPNLWELAEMLCNSAWRLLDSDVGLTQPSRLTLRVMIPSRITLLRHSLWSTIMICLSGRPPSGLGFSMFTFGNTGPRQQPLIGVEKKPFTPLNWRRFVWHK